jgi:hypothetical protein
MRNGRNLAPDDAEARFPSLCYGKMLPPGYREQIEASRQIKRTVDKVISSIPTAIWRGMLGRWHGFFLVSTFKRSVAPLSTASCANDD